MSVESVLPWPQRLKECADLEIETLIETVLHAKERFVLGAGGGHVALATETRDMASGCPC